MTRLGLLFIPLFVVPLLSARDLAAQAPARRVELVFEGTWDPTVVSAVQGDLASEHAFQGVPSGAVGGHLVRVVFSRVGAVIHIRASNALTNLERERDVSLEGLPLDSYGVVIAAAADELVSATWPDDMRFGAPPPPEPIAPPPPEPLPSPVHADTWALGVLPIVDLYQHGQPHIGVDVRLAQRPITALGWAIRLGTRRAIDEHTALGTVRRRDLSLAVEAFTSFLTRSTVVRLDLFALTRVSAVALSSSGETATGGTAWGYGIDARAGMRLVFVPKGLVRPLCELGVGASPRRVVATDGTNRIAGPRGIEGGIACGAELAW